MGRNRSKGTEYNPDPDGRYKVDLWQSFLRSIPWLAFFSIVYFFVFTGLNIVGSVSDDMIKMFGLLGVLFMTFKFVSWIGYPTIVLKELK